MRIDGHSRRTAWRVADDMLLTASSGKELEKMLSELDVAVGRVGLELDYGKTMAMNNAIARHEDGIRDADRVQKSSGTGRRLTTKYLGRALRLDRQNDAGIEAGVKVVRRKCMAMRSELCCKACPLRKRLRLSSPFRGHGVEEFPLCSRNEDI